MAQQGCNRVVLAHVYLRGHYTTVSSFLSGALLETAHGLSMLEKQHTLIFQLGLSEAA